MVHTSKTHLNGDWGRLQRGFSQIGSFFFKSTCPTICWFCPVVAVIAGTGGKEGCVAELMPGMGFPLAEWPGTE